MSRGERPELELKRLPTLNRKIWGIHKGKMAVVAGRTSQAKSVVASNFAWDLATQGKKVYFISLEMSVHQIIERMFCLEHGIDGYDLLTGKLKYSKHIQDNFEKFIVRLKTMNLLMSDMIGRNWQQVDAVVEALGKKPDIVIIDHLQEITAKGMEKHVAIEEYLNHLREMAIRNNFALVVCSQINRMGQSDKDRRPQLHQLKGSGAIEEKADMVMLLHWQYHYDDTKDRNLLEINIAKNRFGATGNIDVRFIPEFSRLEDYNATTYKKPDVSTRIIGEHSEEGDLLQEPIQPERAVEPGACNLKPEDIVWEE